MIQRSCAGYWLLLSGVSLWLSLVLLTPYAVQHLSIVASASYFFFHQVCHQLPERSFWWNGYPISVCHRCLGLYMGFWLGLIIWPQLKALSHSLTMRPRLMLIFFVPLLVDVVAGNNSWSRFATGLVAAFPVAFFVGMAVQQWQYRGMTRS